MSSSEIRPTSETGAKIIDGQWQESKFGIKNHPTNKFQNFVSVKYGFSRITNLGEDNYFASFVNIGHDCMIGKNCMLAPGAVMLGYSEIGNHVFVGANAVIRNRVKVGSWVKIRAGEIVNQDVPDGVYYKKGRFIPNKEAPEKIRWKRESAGSTTTSEKP